MQGEMYAQKSFLFTRSNFRSCIDFYKRFSYYTLLLIQGNFFFPVHAFFTRFCGYASISLLCDLQQIFHQCMALLQQIDLFL